MSKVEDLLISKMSDSEKSKASIEIMQNNSGWSYDDSTKSTLRKLGWRNNNNTSSTKDDIVFIILFFIIPLVGGIIGFYNGYTEVEGLKPLFGVVYAIGGLIIGAIVSFFLGIALSLVALILGIFGIKI